MIRELLHVYLAKLREVRGSPTQWTELLRILGLISIADMQILRLFRLVCRDIREFRGRLVRCLSLFHEFCGRVAEKVSESFGSCGRFQGWTAVPASPRRAGSRVCGTFPRAGEPWIHGCCGLQFCPASTRGSRLTAGGGRAREGAGAPA